MGITLHLNSITAGSQSYWERAISLFRNKGYVVIPTYDSRGNIYKIHIRDIDTRYTESLVERVRDLNV